MTGEYYPYKVAAVYPDGRTAAAAVQVLDAAAVDDVRVIELAPDATHIDIDSAIGPESGASRDTVTRYAAAGAVAGTAVGVAAAAGPALFISAPVVAPLIVLGYGAMIGGAKEVIHGFRLSGNVLAALVKDVLKAGYYVVILHAANDKAQQHAKALIRATLPEQTAHNQSRLQG